MDDDETKTAPEVLERQRKFERVAKLMENNPKVKRKYLSVIESFEHNHNYNQKELFAKLMEAMRVTLMR